MVQAFYFEAFGPVSSSDYLWKRVGRKDLHGRRKDCRLYYLSQPLSTVYLIITSLHQTIHLRSIS